MRFPEGDVTKALTLPSPVGVTERASTVKSVVESKKTPKNKQLICRNEK